jgi:hypothetical protein
MFGYGNKGKSKVIFIIDGLTSLVVFNTLNVFIECRIESGGSLGRFKMAVV